MENLASELTGIKTAAIAGHIRPDGDCVGSCLGLYLYLRENYPEIQVDLYLEEPRKSFHILKALENIKTVYQDEKSYDLLFILDVSSSDRIGVAGKALEKAGKTICIDHHVSNFGLADINVIQPSVGSASEVLYTLMEPEKVTKEAAEAIYMGMVHDTGNFKFSSTTPRTMRIAADLMGKGIDFTRLIERTYYQKSYVQNQILGRCLMESILMLDGKCIIGCVRRKDMEFYGVEPKELDGIVDQLRVTQGVEIAAFLYEVKNQEFKVSLRSNGEEDVNAIASYFSGGGHVKAAGCTMQGQVYDVINNLMPHIEKQIKDNCCD